MHSFPTAGVDIQRVGGRRVGNDDLECRRFAGLFEPASIDQLEVLFAIIIERRDDVVRSIRSKQVFALAASSTPLPQ